MQITLINASWAISHKSKSMLSSHATTIHYTPPRISIGLSLCRMIYKLHLAMAPMNNINLISMHTNKTNRTNRIDRYNNRNNKNNRIDRRNRIDRIDRIDINNNR